MSWIHFSDLVNLSHVEWPHLNDLVVFIFVVLIVHALVIVNVVQSKFPVHLTDHQVENGNDVSWIVLQLSVQTLVELVNMVAVHIEDIFFDLLNLLQLVDIVGGFKVVIILVVILITLVFHESVDKVFEFALHFIRVDICAPQHLGS